MPIYEFKCDKCGKIFERLVFPSDNNKFVCPYCGGSVNKKLMSSFSFSFGSTNKPACTSNVCTSTK